jgi:HNH endonuclease
MATTNLTTERLRELLEYDKDTGVFTHKIKKGFTRVGIVAGCTNNIGYQVINVLKTIHLAHRLAWLYVYGEHPIYCIDHINGDRLDNRIVNLRDIPKAQNHQNIKGPISSNTSGHLGVHFSKRRNAFIAQIALNQKRIYIGQFKTIDDASAAYLNAKRMMHPANTL